VIVFIDREQVLNSYIYINNKFLDDYTIDRRISFPKFGRLKRSFISSLSVLLNFLLKNWRCWCNLASIEDCGCECKSRNLLIRVQIPDTALYEVKGGSKAAAFVVALLQSKRRFKNKVFVAAPPSFLWKDLNKMENRGVSA
jgi:hypothetical protein